MEQAVECLAEETKVFAENLPCCNVVYYKSQMM
jgi:hypothetical protein